MTPEWGKMRFPNAGYREWVRQIPDPEFRDSVARLLRTVGLHAREFSSVPDFLKADPPDGPTCLVLDVRMPGRSGLELQSELVAANRQVPIIFITAHADVPMTVQAMKGGAIEFLTKPFRDQDLVCTENLIRVYRMIKSAKLAR
jgi:FixJ family two-component response regulator